MTSEGPVSAGHLPNILSYMTIYDNSDKVFKKIIFLKNIFRFWIVLVNLKIKNKNKKNYNHNWICIIPSVCRKGFLWGKE